MKNRLPGFITAGVLLIVALTGVISIARLSDSQIAINRLDVLAKREELREQLVEFEDMLRVGRRFEVERISMFELPSQSKFNLAGLYDRLGPQSSVFLDSKQLSIFDRLLVSCGLQGVVRDKVFTWVRERPTQQRVLPIDALITFGLLDKRALQKAWACLRFDPPIYRTRILEANPNVLSAWLAIDTQQAVRIKERVAAQSTYNPEIAISIVNSMSRDARGSVAELNELGFSASPALRNFVFFYDDVPFAHWSVGKVSNQGRAILSRRVFWYPDRSGDLRQ